MVTVDDFSRLVSGIYAAAVTPTHWELAIGEIHRALGGSGAALAKAEDTISTAQNMSVPGGGDRDYAEHYGRLDYVLAATEKGPIGAVRTGTELIVPRRDSEFHAGWLRPYDMEDGLFVRLTDGPSPTCLMLGAPRRSEAFDTPERVKLMGGLVIHLAQALRIGNRLAALAHDSLDLAGALEVVRYGVIIVGSGFWVINFNSAAEAILRAEDGVHLQSACITTATVQTDRKLNHALHIALTDDGSRTRTGQSFTCERPSGKRAYVIHVLPLHHTATDETSSEATALVLIVDPENGPEPPAALLRRLYGLTPTEAQVAARITRGADLRQIADELSVTYTTVRTHLRHIFDKTDTHRQADLVRMLLTLTP